MKKKSTMKLVFIGVLLLLLFVFVYSGLRILESTVFLKQQEEAPISSKIIVHEGVRYFPRQDITTLMLIGVQKSGMVCEYEANHDYPADMICLLIFDQKTKKCELLTLNRDTMTMISALDAFGREDGEYYTQLALSHTFGSGREDSGENTRKAVSNLLGGVNIDYYFSLNTDAIALLNDAVGGVTVNVSDDFSRVDPTIQKGTMTLKGQQALTFVQSRRNVGDQLNLSRMERQAEYMKGFVAALRKTMAETSDLSVKIYEKISPYMVTDCSVSVLNRLIKEYGDYELGKVWTLPGENMKGKSHYEFYVDADEIRPIVLELFYKQIDG